MYNCVDRNNGANMDISKIRNAILVNEFNENGVRNFKNDFDELRMSNLPIIPVIIDSYGGEVYSLLAMLDIMSTADRPVATIAIGKAMSCGSALLACGGSPGLRFIGPHSTVMIHDVGTISVGKVEDLKADIGEAERLNNKIFEMLNTFCKKPKGYFQSLVAEKKHCNWFLDSQEALKHGLVDHIGLPVIDSLFNLNVIKEKVVAGEQHEKKVVLREKRKVPKKRRK
jgi:ATP-dependent protease ClpP protease subunit